MNCSVVDTSTPAVDAVCFVTQLDPYAAQPLRGRILALPPAVKFGACTRAILRELDYDEESIDALLENGVISKSWNRKNLPC